MDVRGKRLLVLGSTKLIAEIVKKAKEMGVYTIVTDNRPLEKAPAKQISDEYCNVDFSDLPAIRQLITEKKINGVLTGFTDSYMQYYFKICEASGLPCYGEQRQIDIATEKAVFKQACMDAGVPVIPGVAASSLEEAESFCRKNGYPVMLKPVDNSGSRGVIKCDERAALPDAFAYAMSFSENKTIIVEKYMDCDNIAVSYFAADGEIRLSTTDDRWMYKSEETGSSASSYSEYPSVYTNRYISEVNDTVVNMLKRNGFQNGMISLQAFVDEKSFYFCEMCFRPSGGQHYLITEDQHQIDQLRLLIEFAVTGECRKNWNANKESPCFQERYAVLRIFGIPGRKIAKLEGFDTLLRDRRVLKASAALTEGTQIGKSGTTAQVIGSILYKFSAEEDRTAIAEELLSRLNIRDETGEPIAWISIEK